MGEKIELGKKVKDSITGFIGTVTARCEYLYSNTQVMIEGKTEGRPVSMWCSEKRVEVQA